MANAEDPVTGAENTLPVWPYWMPMSQRSGYTYEPVDRTVKTEMEVGSIKRIEFDTDETTITCSMILRNDTELEFFEKFERDVLKQGTSWFQMPLWIAGRQDLYTIRFNGRPKMQEILGSHHAKVAFKLDIERRILLEPEIDLETVCARRPDHDAVTETADADAVTGTAGAETETMTKPVLPIWPYWMPIPQRTGYAYEPADRTVKTKIEMGGINHLEFDTDETTITCSMILRTDQELEFFEKFERDVLKQGTSWFQMPLWIAGRQDLYTVRFNGRPKMQEILGSHHAKVAFKLDIERRILLEPEIDLETVCARRPDPDAVTETATQP